MVVVQHLHRMVHKLDQNPGRQGRGLVVLWWVSHGNETIPSMVGGVMATGRAVQVKGSKQ
jgi:hypothetical protein